MRFLGEAVVFAAIATVLAVVIVEVALTFTPINELMGFRPVERDTRYQVVKEYGAPVSMAERRSEPQQVWA